MRQKDRVLRRISQSSRKGFTGNLRITSQGETSISLNTKVILYQPNLHSVRIINFFEMISRHQFHFKLQHVFAC